MNRAGRGGLRPAKRYDPPRQFEWRAKGPDVTEEIEDDGFITVYPPVERLRNHGEETARFMATLPADLEKLCAQRAELLERLADVLDDAALGILEETVLATGGVWLIPPEPGREHWPPSHLAEINVLGIWAAGRTRGELIDNWRKAARRETDRGEA